MERSIVSLFIPYLVVGKAFLLARDLPPNRNPSKDKFRHGLEDCLVSNLCGQFCVYERVLRPAILISGLTKGVRRR